MGCLNLFFGRNHFDCLSQLIFKYWALPHNKIQVGSLLAHLYSLYIWNFNFKKNLWDKVWFYWEHLEEHIGGSLCETTLRTIVERIGNTWEHQNSKTLIPTPISLGGTNIGSYTISSYQNRFWYEISSKWNEKMHSQICVCVFSQQTFFSTP
jgi:hypothetical protein